VFFVPGRELNLPPAPELTFENNPWRGLNSYEQTDAALFFGRDAEIGALQARIVANPMTVVLGGSGVGKSSLVKAGVLPKLSAEGWLVLPAMRPGTTPLIALAQSLGMMSDAPMRAAPTPDAIAAAMAKRIAEDPKRQVILVIDQFEEMITLVRAGRERDQMLALLARLVKAHVGTLHVVVTIRTDYEPNFDWSAFGEKWQDGRYVLPPMLARANLRAVIEKPAAVRVLYFDPSALIETLLDEIADNPGALPLLSFALSEMYIGYVKRKSGDRAIARVDYDAIGGVVGVLRSRAEAEYATLDSAQQATLKRVMLRLVTAEGGAIARRRAVEAEMQFADPKEQERAKVVIQRFTNARLLVEGQEPDGDKFVEPAHDALVRAWGRLLQWVREESEAAFSLAQQQRLARSAVEWDRADTEAKSGLLWSDASRSDQLAPLVRAKAPWFNVREMAFARRSVRGRRIAKMVTVGVAALIAVSGVVSAVQWRRAEAERVVAMEQREEAQKQRSEAMAQRAVAMDEKARALRSLFSSLSVSMARGNPGSLCIQPTCADAPPSDSGVWISLSRIPESLASLAGEEKSRDFIAAREDGRGHVLVYAHDGLTQDEEMAYGGDNMLFAENALRWLGTTNGSRPDVAQNCPGGPPLVLVWEGSFVPLRFMTRVSESVRARGWAIEAARPETFSARLRCAAVLWYLSDWRPPADFATTYVPQIKQFVRNGGGLLVGGLGWSYWQLTNLHPETPDGPYAADELGKAFGFSFTRDAFRAPEGEPVALLGAR
jgi:hypothetical protein